MIIKGIIMGKRKRFKKDMYEEMYADRNRYQKDSDKNEDKDPDI